MRSGHTTRLGYPPEYSVVLERLYKLGQGRMLLGRDRLRRLLELAGDPHLKVPSILVGGTNGKGSLVAALSATLSLKLPTAAFIKPHLKTIRERWRINDQPIEPDAFVTVATKALDLIESHDEPISFFEANVLIGALAFAESGCGIAIWEVGLGGREDACNLVEPLISIITNVGLDHTQILGNTVQEIALDKAGIARADRPLVLGPPRPVQLPAYSKYEPVISSEAERVGADYHRLPFISDIAWEHSRNSRIQPDTMAVAEFCLRRLADLGLAEAPQDLDAALSGYRYRARMERTELLGQPVLIDAAHNPDSMRWLAWRLQQEFGRPLPVLFGCQKTRNPLELLEPLNGLVSCLIPAAVPVLSPMHVNQIRQAATNLGFALPHNSLGSSQMPLEFPLGNNLETSYPDNSTGWIEAVKTGLELAAEDRPLVICGSIYMIGEILRVFEDGWLDEKYSQSQP